MDSENQMSEDYFFTLVSNVVEKHGCKIKDVDFENQVLHLDGPDEAVSDCAKALAEFFD